MTVTVELDTDERVVEVPPEPAAALAASPVAADRFATLSASHRRRRAEHVDEAKSEATRERRARRAVEQLTAEGRPG